MLHALFDEYCTLHASIIPVQYNVNVSVRVACTMRVLSQCNTMSISLYMLLVLCEYYPSAIQCQYLCTCCLYYASTIPVQYNVNSLYVLLAVHCTVCGCTQHVPVTRSQFSQTQLPQRFSNQRQTGYCLLVQNLWDQMKRYVLTGCT